MHQELKAFGINSLLMSPGNVLSSITISAVHPFVLLMVLYVLRIAGCSGINISGHNAGFAAEWLAKSQFELLNPTFVYHSDITRFANSWTRLIKVDYTDEDEKETRIVLQKMDEIVRANSN